MKKKIMEIVTRLEDMKIELERARFMSEELSEMYSDTNKNDETKVYEWDRCSKMADVELVHVAKADECAEMVYDLLKALLDELKTREGKGK